MTGFVTEIDLHGVVELEEAFALAPEIASEEMVRAATEATLLLERETRELTPVGVGGDGGLRGSFSARPPRIEGDVVIGEMGTPLDYALPVELGSRPHFPPIAPIEDWVRHKLDVPAEQARRVAFAVARKISREGTEGAHMVRRAWEANQEQVARIYEGTLARIRDRIASAGS